MYIPGYIEKQGKQRQKEFWNFYLIFYLRTRKSRVGKFKITYNFLNFLLNFLVCKIKEWEFQKKFCRTLPNFYIYPANLKRMFYFPIQNCIHGYHIWLLFLFIWMNFLIEWYAEVIKNYIHVQLQRLLFPCWHFSYERHGPIVSL